MNGTSESNSLNNSSNGDFFIKYRDERTFNNRKSIEECFRYFDRNRDSALDLNEFEMMLKSLYSFSGNSYFLQKPKIKAMFNFFDTNRDDKISIDEFERFWFKMVKPTLLPKSALVIVDVQNDFIDGTLALKRCEAKQDGAEVVPCINHLIDTVPFDVIAYTLDWHPDDHVSFIENVNMRKLSPNSPIHHNIKTYDTVIFENYPDIEQKLWPAHCIMDSMGAELHPDLRVIDERTDKMRRSVVYVKKGCKPDIDSYSAFFDNCKLNETSLNSDLKKHGITDLYVCGLAADVCVAATSYDGLCLNYRVVYVEDACRGVDVKDIEEQKRKLVNNGALMVHSKQVYNMVTCKDRRPELAYSTLMHLLDSSNQKHNHH